MHTIKEMCVQVQARPYSQAVYAVWKECLPVLIVARSSSKCGGQTGHHSSWSGVDDVSASQQSFCIISAVIAKPCLYP